MPLRIATLSTIAAARSRLRALRVARVAFSESQRRDRIPGPGTCLRNAYHHAAAEHDGLPVAQASRRAAWSHPSARAARPRASCVPATATRQIHGLRPDFSASSSGRCATSACTTSIARGAASRASVSRRLLIDLRVQQRCGDRFWRRRGHDWRRGGMGLRRLPDGRRRQTSALSIIMS